MIMSLFVDYCDADFYNTFVPCDEHNISPYMSDSLDTLLEKLIQLEWNTVTSAENLPGIPKNFEGHFDIMLGGQDFGGTRSFIVESLRNTSKVDVNLKDLDEYNSFERYWRIR